MITLQLDTSSEQAQALFDYLKTLPYVWLMEENENESLEEESFPTPLVTTELLLENAKSSLVENRFIFNEQLEKRLLVDLKKSLSLNDKFRFLRDLFQHDENEMNKTLDYLNSLSSFSEAWGFLNDAYHWNPNDDSTIAFQQLLEKRYS